MQVKMTLSRCLLRLYGRPIKDHPLKDPWGLEWELAQKAMKWSRFSNAIAKTKMHVQFQSRCDTYTIRSLAA